MKSLFAKILLWFWVTLAITVVGSAFISALNVNENASDERAPVARLVRFQLEEARSAYEIGGAAGVGGGDGAAGGVMGAVFFTAETQRR